jgi:hypothetical protein
MAADDNPFLHPIDCPIREGGPVEVEGWYFWDEADDYHGPFATKDEADAALHRYAEEV